MKRSPLLVIFVTVFIDLIGFGIVIPVLPFYVEGAKFNATPRAVGLLFASYSIMQLIFTPLLGRLSDRYGRRPILFLSLLGTSLGFLILGFATTLLMLFFVRIIDGITGGNISTAQAYIADVTTREERAKGMGLIGAAFGLGFTFGPAIGGVLSKWGISVPLVIAGALLFAFALFAIPLVHPGMGLAALLVVGALFGVGNSLATPSLQTLASKSVGAGEQGGVLGVVQSVASLARAVGPTLAAWLIYSAV